MVESIREMRVFSAKFHCVVGFGLVAALLPATAARGLDLATAQVEADALWNAGYTGSGVEIGVLDLFAADATHSALNSNYRGTVNFAGLIAVVADAAADPLEQAEDVLSALAQRGLELATVPRNQLDPADPRRRSAVLLASKADLAPTGSMDALSKLYDGRIEVLPVSAVTGEGLDRLGRRLWELLSVIRVYTKEPGKPVDTDRPYTLPVGATVEELAREVHRDLPEKMTFARLWGHGRFKGQRAHRSEVLQDKDVVEIHQ